MARHGAESHYLRPDGVYITSVLQPTVGYDPVADAQAVGASFVSSVGLAGPVATAYRRHRNVSLLGAPTFSNLKNWWSAFKVRVQTNLVANKYGVSMLPAAASAQAAAASGKQVTVDTSPRPPNADPTALATQSGWAPGPQSPKTAAAAVYSSAPADPPNQGATVTAVAMAPGEAAAPVGFWQGITQSGFPPVVAARAEVDSLRRWFSSKAG